MLVRTQPVCEYTEFTQASLSTSIQHLFPIYTLPSLAQYENTIPTNTAQANRSFQVRYPPERAECRHGNHIILRELIVLEDKPAKSDAAGPYPIDEEKRDVAEAPRVSRCDRLCDLGSDKKNHLIIFFGFGFQ